MTVLAQGGDPPEPPAEGLAQGGDPPEPPAEGLARGGDRPEPPAEGLARGGDPPELPADGLADVAGQWPVVASVTFARGRLVTLRTDQVRMPDGQIAERDVVEHPGAVAVVALDEAGRVLMIRQYRHPVRRVLWEIPAGLRDVDGEPPYITAERELLEETGYRARDWHVLADYFSSPGIITERLRVFLARGLSEVPAADRKYVPEDEEAQLLVGWLPLDQAAAHVLSGDLHNGPAVVGILSAYAARLGGFAGLRPRDAPER